jgi:tetratricopeptide (TPR) repeat protein
LYIFKDRAKALDLLNSGLALARAINNRRGEAIELIRIAEIYMGQKRYDEARSYFEQAIKISRESKEVGVEGWALSSLGHLQRMQAEYEKAMESFQAAFAIHRNLKDFFILDQIRISIGSVYRDLKQYDKALEQHFKAIDALNEQNAPTSYFMYVYTELMKDYQAIGQPENAIFFGKHGVNRMQEIRRSFRNFSPDLLRTMRQSNETPYHVLADLLISQARLPEAEQVLRMLKEEEYFEYIRGNANDAVKGEKATLTPKEEAADKRYREVADKLAALGAERSALLNKPSRTEAENQRLKQIESDLAVAGQAFQKFLDKLHDELKTTKDAGKVSHLREAQGLMEDLRELGQGAVALYTVVGEDTFSLVLTTADVQKAYQVPIKATELIAGFV